MATIPADEWEDAVAAAKECGYGEGEFVAEYIEYRSLREGVAPIIADVKITHTPSGIEVTYDASSGSTWPADFAGDVKAGRFGVITGQRRVRGRWVQVRATADAGNVYEVQPEEGNAFFVRAQNDAELVDSIVSELLRRSSGGL